MSNMNEIPQRGDRIRILSTKTPTDDIKVGAVGEVLDVIMKPAGAEWVVRMIDVQWPSGNDSCIRPDEETWDFPEWNADAQRKIDCASCKGADEPEEKSPCSFCAPPEKPGERSDFWTPKPTKKKVKA